MSPDSAIVATAAIATVAALGVVLRPFRTHEAFWAVGGAALMVAAGLLSCGAALAAAGKGLDVYLFLAGMMLLAEVARREGLFDAVAAFAVTRAGGSPRRLFALVYAAGVVVTAFLSNDATAVVMTPAVLAAARRAKADPLPHLFACAFVANAASFVLPISNPANLVLYAGHAPALGDWLARLALPSALAIAAAFASLGWAERRALGGDCAREAEGPKLGAAGKAAVAGLVASAVALPLV
ncbi:MAG: SLC13 family permease, partial [Caulobacteraceae bacterium]